MKKILLHEHLDGAANIAYASALSGRDVSAEMRSKNDKSLSDFLDKFSLPLSLMQTRERLIKFSELLAKDLVKDEVIYAEIRFCPLLHTRQGLSPRAVVQAVLDGLENVTAMKTNLILCMMRHFTFSDNAKIIDLARGFNGAGVVAIDLAGDEAMYPNSNPEYAKLFHYAQKLGVPYTIHAGEADSYIGVEAALSLGAKRIGHGIRAAESEATLQHLVETQVPLEICPTSNLKTGVCDAIDHYPFGKLLRAGARLTINTDDRTVCDTTLTQEYALLRRHANFTDVDFLLCNLNAAHASFADESTKTSLRTELLAEYYRD